MGIETDKIHINFILMQIINLISLFLINLNKNNNEEDLYFIINASDRNCGADLYRGSDQYE